MIKKFRDFINRGITVEIAVAFIMGRAFAAHRDPRLAPLLKLFMTRTGRETARFDMEKAPAGRSLP